MKKALEYILLCLAVCICLLPSCRRAKIMSEKDMADIYAEMFLADQWLNDNYTLRKKADTTRFYEAIFKKYGYTFEDYDASVNHYLRKPEKYRKILARSAKKLRSGFNALDKFEKEIERQNAILAGLSYLHLPEFAPDSIRIDTSLTWSPWRDTLRVRDSIRRDSLLHVAMVRDSIRRDSLRRDSLRQDSILRRKQTLRFRK